MSIANDLLEINIEDELRNAYLDYAMSVIVGRALPDVRDGLKPVQRRVLYAMNEMGLTPGAAYKKCAGIVGEVMGNYHPHGDASIYDTLVRMAQPFNARYPLVQGQGNFGSVEGDGAAAMRYTEARLSPLALEMLADIDFDTVDFVPNYDNSKMQPSVLPGRFPNLLANGSTGIAVGMATNIPPHNLREVCDAVMLLIDNPNAGVEELMTAIKGPDFPSYGMILGARGIRDAYTTGRGTVVMQGKFEIEELAGGKFSIVITELPYQVNPSTLITQIADMVKDKKLPEITDIQNHSDRHGMRLYIELRRDSYPRKVVNYLLKHTPLRTNFSVNIVGLVDDGPRLLGLQDLLRSYLEHRQEVIVRRSNYELDRKRQRAHILEGLRIAIDFLDEVIQLIRASRSPEVARDGLMTRFGLSSAQAQAILDMMLRSLTGLEREKIEGEYRDVAMRIAYLEDLLCTPAKILAIVRQEMKDLRDKFGDDRRTKIIPLEADEIGEEDTIPVEQMVLTITRDNYIKRVPIDTYREQRRAGRGIIAMSTKEEDTVEHIFVATTHHRILFFTNKGKVYRLKTYEVPQSSRTSMGTNIINLIGIEPGEQITAAMPLAKEHEPGYVIMCTEKGVIKRTDLDALDEPRRGGLIAINLQDDDELKWVAHTDGARDVMIITRNGLTNRFEESDVRSMGRTAAGVRGIRLQGNDRVVSMVIVRDDAQLLCITHKGQGKRTPFTEYTRHHRGGKGVLTFRITDKSGPVVGAKAVTSEDKMLIVTEQGIIIRVKVGEISETKGRVTQGVKLINLESGDKVSTIALVPEKPAREEIPTAAPAPAGSPGGDGASAAEDEDNEEVEEVEELELE
ncbi:MAG TPA: DNA gyrase subunit A [Armatimonadota bacterium]|nr:DNA gyrase subunit A [Armatimonadota bacterium]